MNDYLDNEDGSSLLIFDDCSILVDTEDVDKLKEYEWTTSDRGYAISGYSISLHRYVMGCKKGDGPVDHIDGVVSNCRKSNLRHCSVQENNRNSRVQHNSTTGIKGVGIVKLSRGTYAKAQVRDAEGKRKYRYFSVTKMGLVDALCAARTAAMQMREQWHGEYVRHV